MLSVDAWPRYWSTLRQLKIPTHTGCCAEGVEADFIRGTGVRYKTRHTHPPMSQAVLLWVARTETFAIARHELTWCDGYCLQHRV
jgi:hypothetical protein